MTLQEIEQWFKEHGGEAATEGPDANGVTIYRAADGNYLSIRKDGSLAMRGFIPPSQTPRPEASTPATAPSGGTNVNQQEVLAQLATIAPGGDPGRLEYVETMEPREVTDTSGLNPVQVKKNVPVRIWYDPATGRAMKFDVGDDGSFTRTFSGIDPTLKRASTTAESGAATTPHIEGTPLPGGGYDNSQPIMVNRDANGRQVGPARPLTAEERQRWERDTGQQQQIASDTKPLEGYPGWMVRTTKTGNDTKTVFVNPQGQEAPDPRPPAKNPNQSAPTQVADGSWGVWDSSSGKPVWIPIANGPAGKKYTDVKFDEQRGQWWGLTPQGTWEPMTGGPGARTGPQKPGPAMPTFIVGMASDALRQFGDQLNAAVAAGDMTPAERDKRYAEAERAAQIAVNDAVTVQRQQESNLNARVNLAATRYTQQMDGLNNALSFVTKLNATLPEGSDLGGKAFAALLGMQAIAARRSGITDIQIPGVDLRTPAGQQVRNAMQNGVAQSNETISRLTNPADPAAVHADQQAVSAALQAPSQPPAPAPVTPAAPGPSGRLSPGYGDNLEYPFTARPAPAPTTAAPVPPTPTLPSSLPPADEFGRTPAMGGATPTPPADLETGTTPPYNDDPSKGPVGTTLPGDDFAIMQTLPSPAPVFAPPPPAVGDHPAILMDRAQTTPPWRLDPSEIERMRAAGIPESTIFSVPGQGVAA